MKINDAVMFVLIVVLVAGLAYQHNLTRNLAQEIKRIDSSIEDFSLAESPPNKPESANTSISNEPETLRRLALKVAALEAGMDTLIKNQDVFVKKHNGLITVVEYMDWSYEEQIRVLNPQYRSPVNGLDLKAVSLEQMPSVSMLTSARLLF